MNILFWTDGFWPRIGGIEIQALRFIEQLQEKGHRCLVIAEKFHSDLADFEIYKGISIARFPFALTLALGKLSNIPVIRDKILSLSHSLQPDIVHLNACFGLNPFAFTLFKTLFKTPLVLTIHSPFYNEKNGNPILQQVVSTADRIGCVSHWAYQKTAELVPSQISKMKLIHNGLPFPKLEEKPLDFTTPSLLMIGRLSPEKGFNIGIQAFALVRQKYPSATLVIAGCGNERIFLEQLANELNLHHAVQFTGALDAEKIPHLLNQATLVLVPSTFESFGLVALEAMQMARPVIASRVGGLEEVIQEGVTGLFVPPGNPQVLFEAIEWLLENPAQAIWFGRNGKKRAEQFTIEQNVTQYETIYQELRTE